MMIIIHEMPIHYKILLIQILKLLQILNKHKIKICARMQKCSFYIQLPKCRPNRWSIIYTSSVILRNKAIKFEQKFAELHKIVV